MSQSGSSAEWWGARSATVLGHETARQEMKVKVACCILVTLEFVLQRGYYVQNEGSFGMCGCVSVSPGCSRSSPRAQKLHNTISGGSGLSFQPFSPRFSARELSLPKCDVPTIARRADLPSHTHTSCGWLGEEEERKRLPEKDSCVKVVL